MIVGGVDLGVRKSAISIFDDGVLSAVADLEVRKTTRAVELRTLGSWTYGHLKVCDWVFVEEPLVGRSTRVSLQIAQTAGAVMSTLGGTDLQIRSDFVDNKTWKKTVVGNGNANKEMIASWLKSSHPAYSDLCGSNQDRIDATCIGLYGVGLLHLSGQLEEL